MGAVKPVSSRSPDTGVDVRKGASSRASHIAIIGGGSAAFACAIRAAEDGARVTLIERGTLGGTCVNVGCVPSKVLVRGGNLARLRAHPPLAGLGECAALVDRRAMLAQQQGLVAELREAKYRRVLEANPRVSLVPGTARFADAKTIAVSHQGAEQRITAARFLIATGSAPSVPPIPGLAEIEFWTSEEALAADIVPEHLIVLGGSAVGLELGQAYLHLGSRVTLIEKFGLLPREDPQVGEELGRILAGEGMRVLTHADVLAVSHDAHGVVVTIAGKMIRGDRLLVATGRRANTAELNLDSVGVTMDAAGAIIVDDQMRTNVPGIFAAGDCTSQPQLVYVAAAAGTRAAINMMGGEVALDLSVVPAVVFTEPQVATVGIDERQATERGLRVRSRTLALTEVPRALVNFDTRGFVKLVASASSGQILGAQIVAPEAGEMIQTVALAIAQRMTFMDLADRLFPYLTMAEGLKLCAQTFTRDVKTLSCCAG